MSPYQWLSIYCLAILIASLCGGRIPFLGRVPHSRLQFYLSASAGVMLGAAFFHVMPDAMDMSGPYFGWWMALGVVGLFGIERFIAPHSHELDGSGRHNHAHEAHPHDKHEPGLGPDPKHEHAFLQAAGHDHRAAAPAIAGWMAVLGLTIHTFINGVGLAGAVQTDIGKLGDGTGTPSRALLGWTLPGLAMFLAIVIHKPADALAISTVLTRKGVSRKTISIVQIGFALTVAAGATVFCLTTGRIAQNLQTQLTGAALAFSTGTFLFIALSDLLPEVQFHRHDRIPLFLSLVAGVALMGFIALLEGHGHGDHEHGASAHGAHVRPGASAAGHDTDHDEDSGDLHEPGRP